MAHRIAENAVNRRAERPPEDRAVAAPNAADTPGGAGERGVTPRGGTPSAADPPRIAAVAAGVVTARTAGPVRAVTRVDAMGLAGTIPATAEAAGTDIRAAVMATARPVTRMIAPVEVGRALAEPAPTTAGVDIRTIVARSAAGIPAIAAGTRAIATAAAGTRMIVARGVAVIRVIRTIARAGVVTPRIVTAAVDSVPIAVTVPIAAGTGALIPSAEISAAVADPDPAPVSAVSPIAVPARVIVTPRGAVAVVSPIAGTSPVVPGRRSGAAGVRATVAPRAVRVRPVTAVLPKPCPVAARIVPSLVATRRAGSAAAVH